MKCARLFRRRKCSRFGYISVGSLYNFQFDAFLMLLSTIRTSKLFLRAPSQKKEIKDWWTWNYTPLRIQIVDKCKWKFFIITACGVKAARFTRSCILQVESWIPLKVSSIRTETNAQEVCLVCAFCWSRAYISSVARVRYKVTVGGIVIYITFEEVFRSTKRPKP